MLSTLIAVFALAAIAPFLHRGFCGATGWLLGSCAAGITSFYAVRLRPSELPLHESWNWIPSLGIHLSFTADGLSLLFALLISAIGALVLIYAGSYLKGDPQLGRLYAFLLMFMGAMLGVVLSSNLLTLIVFWELTSLSSYLLIGFHHDRAASRAAALQALLVTGGGGLAMLAGFVLLGLLGGTYEVPELIARRELILASPLSTAALVLVLIGAFTKSAQFPFHFWLPGAMEAPTPISAYLHSATMVKAGVYLLARLAPLFGDTALWQGALMVFGGLTMLIGAVLAIREWDLKRILAYSTVSALGTLVMLLGSATQSAEAAKAAVVFLLVHSFYKGALFLVAGAIDHEAGTRDVRELSGLRRAMPITAAAAVVAAFSMAGVPPMFGFVGKELLYEATWNATQFPGLLTGVSVLANVLMFAVAGIVAIGPFFGPRRTTPHTPHEAPLSLWLGPVLLGTLGLVCGILPVSRLDDVIAAGATTIAGREVEVHLALWHGFNVMLALSAVTIAGGLLVYFAHPHLRQAGAKLDPLLRLGPQAWYAFALRALVGVAEWQTRLLQNGVLGLYMVTVIVTTVGLVGSMIVAHLVGDLSLAWTSAGTFEIMLAVLIGLAALLAVVTNSRLAAVAAMGAVGYGMAIVFLLFGAPDLAMTQFAIETLTVVVFLFVMSKLPRFGKLSTAPARLRDALVAIAAGTTITVLVLLILGHPVDSNVSPFYLAESYPAAKGRNVVNVILVDFRGLDTIGEITVLAVAAIGTYGLLKLRLDQREKKP